MQQISATAMQAMPQRLAGLAKQLQDSNSLSQLLTEFAPDRFCKFTAEEDAAYDCLFRRLVCGDASVFHGILTQMNNKLCEGTDAEEASAILAVLYLGTSASNFFRCVSVDDRNTALYIYTSLTLSFLTRKGPCSTQRDQEALVVFCLLRRLVIFLYKRRSDAFDAVWDCLVENDPETLAQWQEQIQSIMAMPCNKSEKDSPWTLVEICGFAICMAFGIRPASPNSILTDTALSPVMQQCLTTPRPSNRLKHVWQALQEFYPEPFRAQDDFVCLTCGAFYLSRFSDRSPQMHQFKVCSRLVSLSVVRSLLIEGLQL